MAADFPEFTLWIFLDGAGMASRYETRRRFFTDPRARKTNGESKDEG
jgi:hypothetical protein